MTPPSPSSRPALALSDTVLFDKAFYCGHHRPNSNDVEDGFIAVDLISSGTQRLTKSTATPGKDEITAVDLIRNASRDEALCHFAVHRLRRPIQEDGEDSQLLRYTRLDLVRSSLSLVRLAPGRQGLRASRLAAPRHSLFKRRTRSSCAIRDFISCAARYLSCA